MQEATGAVCSIRTSNSSFFIASNAICAKHFIFLDFGFLADNAGNFFLLGCAQGNILSSVCVVFRFELHSWNQWLSTIACLLPINILWFTGSVHLIDTKHSQVVSCFRLQFSSDRYLVFSFSCCSEIVAIKGALWVCVNSSNFSFQNVGIFGRSLNAWILDFSGVFVLRDNVVESARMSALASDCLVALWAWFRVVESQFGCAYNGIDNSNSHIVWSFVRSLVCSGKGPRKDGCRRIWFIGSRHLFSFDNKLNLAGSVFFSELHCFLGRNKLNVLWSDIIGAINFQGFGGSVNSNISFWHLACEIKDNWQRSASVGHIVISSNFQSNLTI